MKTTKITIEPGAELEINGKLIIVNSDSSILTMADIPATPHFEKPVSKRFEPGMGEYYEFIDMKGSIYKYRWDNTDFNYQLFNFRNLFRPGDAQKELDKRILLAQIWNKAEEEDMELATPNYKGRIYTWGYYREKKCWYKLLDFYSFGYFFPNFINEADRDTIFELFKDKLDIFLI